MRTALSRTEVADAEQLLKDLIFDLSNNLDTPTALNRLVLWAKNHRKMLHIINLGKYLGQLILYWV